MMTRASGASKGTWRTGIIRLHHSITTMIKTMKTSTLLILAVLFAGQGCTDSHVGSTKDPQALVIPALPTRTAEYGNPKEYDHLLDIYDNAKIQLRKNPEDPQALLRIAEVFITDARITGHYTQGHDAAIAILDHLIAGQTATHTKAQAYALKAVIRLNQHDFQDALIVGEQAVKLDPYRAFNQGILVDANTELGNYAAAVVHCDKMVAMRPDLRSYSRVSYQREIHGDIDGAIDAMGMAIRSGVPGSDETCWCLLQLGGIHERNGDIKNAIACYRESLAERTNYAYAMDALARVLGKQGEYAEAEQLLKKATAIMGQAGFHEDLARVYKAQGKNKEYESAVDSAEMALLGLVKGMEGHNHQIGLEMAKFQFEFRGQLELALKNAEHELTHRPTNIDVNRLLAELYYAKGDMTKAEEHVKLAASTGSTSAELYCIQGLIAMKMGDPTGKILVAKAIADDPYQTGPTADVARRSI